MKYILVAYDVVRDRRRARLARRLNAVVPRVQKSVFEGPVDAEGLGAVTTAVMDEIDHRTDTVRILELCPGCARRVDVYGTAALVPLEAEDVVIDGDEE